MRNQAGLALVINKGNDIAVGTKKSPEGTAEYRQGCSAAEPLQIVIPHKNPEGVAAIVSLVRFAKQRMIICVLPPPSGLDYIGHSYTGVPLRYTPACVLSAFQASMPTAISLPLKEPGNSKKGMPGSSYKPIENLYGFPPF